MAFPINVAPKNVQKGTKKWPHVIPAKSNNGFGMEAHAKIPKNPTRSTNLSIPNLARSNQFMSSLLANFSCNSSNSSSSSSGSYPDNLCTLAMKYGGNSPKAVPAPQQKASIRTLLIIAHMVMAALVAAFVSGFTSGHKIDSG